MSDLVGNPEDSFLTSRLKWCITLFLYFQDKDFGKQAIFRAHVNPPASVVTTIKAYQKYFLKKAYIGEDVFWGLSPSEGDTVEFRFDPAIEIERFVLTITKSPFPSLLLSPT